jgi:hypothetical protein
MLLRRKLSQQSTEPPTATGQAGEAKRPIPKPKRRKLAAIQHKPKSPVY